MATEPIRWRAFLQVALAVTLTFLFFYMMSPFVLAMLIAAIIAIICYPAFIHLNTFLPKTLAALIVTVAVAMGVLLPAVGAFVVSAYQLSTWLKGIRLTDGNLFTRLTDSSAWNGIVANAIHFLPVDMEWIQQYAMNTLGIVIEKFSQFAANAISTLPGFLLAASIVIISVFFFILDGARLLRFLGDLSPLPPGKSLELYHSFERSCRGVVMAMMASCLVQGLLVSLFFLITGVPRPMMWGFASLFMGMVPIVGVAPITVGGLVYLILTHHTLMAIVLGAGAIAVGMADNIVRPLVMKGQAEMHPLLALVSALGAVSWMGATGIFLGPIIAAVFVTFLKIVSRELANTPKNDQN